MSQTFVKPRHKHTTKNERGKQIKTDQELGLPLMEISRQNIFDQNDLNVESSDRDNGF